MNEVLEAIRNRRSTRKFESTSIEDEKIRAILTAAQWAPSFMNLQPWKFILVREFDTKEQLVKALTMPFLQIVYRGPLPYENLTKAPIIIVTCVDPNRDRLHYVEDGACATQNMALAAHSLGLGSYWIGVFNTFVEDEVKKILEIPKGYRVISLMPIGVPAESPEKERKNLDNMLHYDKFGQGTP